MHLTSFYPVLMSSNVSRLASFYRDHFGFETAFETDWYVSLFANAGAARFELAILDSGHPTVPQGFGASARGVILNLEVADATSEYARLVGEQQLPEVLALRDEEFGQRHFIVHDPDRNLVDVIENIPPSDTFAENYSQSG